MIKYEVPKLTIFQNLSNGCYLLFQIITLPRQDYGQQLKIQPSGMSPNQPPAMNYCHNCNKSPLETTVKPLTFIPWILLLTLNASINNRTLGIWRTEDQISCGTDWVLTVL